MDTLTFDVAKFWNQMSSHSRWLFIDETHLPDSFDRYSWNDIPLEFRQVLLADLEKTFSPDPDPVFSVVAGVPEARRNQ
jgi:hypothetical protein